MGEEARRIEARAGLHLPPSAQLLGNTHVDRRFEQSLRSPALNGRSDCHRAGGPKLGRQAQRRFPRLHDDARGAAVVAADLAEWIYDRGRVAIVVFAEPRYFSDRSF